MRKWPSFALVAFPLTVVFVALACGDDEPGVTPTNDPDSATGNGDDGSSANGDGANNNNGDGSLDSGPGTGLSPTFVHRDINHVLGTGQSLSVGAASGVPLSLTQPFANTMFSRGIAPGGTLLTAFAPLVEGIGDGGVGPNVETMSAGFANLITKMAREELLVGQPAEKTSHDLLVSLHGVGGIAYSGLKKGTSPFANGMEQAKAGFAIAKAMNKSYVVRAVTNVHGETDHINNNTAYEANLVEWQSDYETDVKAITAQTDPIPMLHTQMSSWTKFNSPTSAIPAAQLSAHLKSNGKIVLVGPKYHLEYAVDGVHLTSKAYRQMGEDYAKVYRRIILEGKKWEPLRPLAVTRVGAVITVKFSVPSPPLVVDTTLVTDPGKNGFEYTDTGIVPPATIQSVALAGPDTVTITLSKEPTGADKRLRYAFTGTSGANGGPLTGARGNLRDSDPTVSRNGDKLFNWCIHFDEAVP